MLFRRCWVLKLGLFRYDPIDYDSWTKTEYSLGGSVTDYTAFTGWENGEFRSFDVECAQWECKTAAPKKTANLHELGCLLWKCVKVDFEEDPEGGALPLSSNQSTPAGHFTGTWFIGEDATRDVNCVQQTCHEPVMGFDSSGAEVVVACPRYRCVQALLATNCVAHYPDGMLTTTERTCHQQCVATAGCTSALFVAEAVLSLPPNTPITSCVLYNIPHGELIGSQGARAADCNMYVPPYTIDPACVDSSKPNSRNTCRGLVPKVDEFGGVHYEQHANVGELWSNRMGVDFVYYGPGRQRLGSVASFDWEGWAVPLVTHHDYILDVDWHIDFQQWSARWSEPYLLQNPDDGAGDPNLPPDVIFSGVKDLMPLPDESVLLSFPFVDYRYRFRVDVPGHPNMPWYDNLADHCVGQDCSLEYPTAGMLD